MLILKNRIAMKKYKNIKSLSITYFFAILNALGAVFIGNDR